MLLYISLKVKNKPIVDMQKERNVSILLKKIIKPQENKRSKQIRTTKTSRKISNEMAINAYLSIIILNIIQLNVSIKRHRVAEWIKN